MSKVKNSIKFLHLTIVNLNCASYGLYLDYQTPRIINMKMMTLSRVFLYGACIDQS